MRGARLVITAASITLGTTLSGCTRDLPVAAPVTTGTGERAHFVGVCEEDNPPAECFNHQALPDDTMQVQCNPSPVMRGQPVSCSVALLAGFHFAGTDSESVQITATEPVIGNETTPDSSRVHPITQRGSFSGNTKWVITGKAIYNTWITAHALVVDDSGRSYDWTGMVSFFVDYPHQDRLALPGFPAESIGAYPDVEVALPNGTVKKTFAATSRPMLESGALNELALYVSSVRPLGSIHVDSATSGPDSGAKYVSSSLSLASLITETSNSLYGSTAWDDAQVGRITRPGKPDSTIASNGLPFCIATADLLSRLASKVLAHEGVTSDDPVSHRSIWEDALAAVDEAPVLQHMYFSISVDSSAMRGQIESRMIRDLEVDGGAQQRHAALDAALPSQLDALLGCGFDNGWRMR